MNTDKLPDALSDTDLDGIQGGGLLDAEPGGFGARHTDGPRGVWKAPAGTEADMSTGIATRSQVKAG